MSLVTIVIPAYNVENYIGKSIESVLQQTESDWELIIVNDGSTDNTLSIIQGYADDQKKIKVIDQKNGGVSVARNVGLAIATGRFISFLDADDFYDPQYIALMVAPLLSGDSNLSFCKYKETLNGAVIAETPLTVNKLYNNELIEHLLEIDKVHNMSLMYSTQNLRENDVRFREGCPNGEDRMFVIDAAFYSKAIFVPHYLYNYIYRENSASRMYISYEKLLSMLDGYLEQKQCFFAMSKSAHIKLYLQYIDKEILGVKNNLRRKMWGDLQDKNFDQVEDILIQYKDRYGEAFNVPYTGFKRFTLYPKMKIIQSQNKKLWQKLF